MVPLGTSGTKELLRENAVVAYRRPSTRMATSRGSASPARFVPFHGRQRSVPGIGHRRDGWPNRDLDVGAIIALSPAIPGPEGGHTRRGVPANTTRATTRTGRTRRSSSHPRSGLAQVKNETYTAEGPISYWNAYVAVTQMHGHGNFSDPRLGIDVKQSPDMVGPKLRRCAPTSIACRRPPPPAAASMPLSQSVDARCLTRTCSSLPRGCDRHR